MELLTVESFFLKDPFCFGASELDSERRCHILLGLSRRLKMTLDVS